jgi:trypsin
MKAVFVLLLALVGFSQTLGKMIVGGSPAPRGRYEWQVGLLSRPTATPYCGGVYVAPRIVFTAAHCPTPAYVMIGCLHWSEDCDRIPVTRGFMNPNYSSRPVPSYDSQVMVMSGPSSFRPIPHVADGTWAQFGEQGQDIPITVIGWGTTSSGGSQSANLLEVEVDSTTNQFCDDAYGSIDNTMLCAARAGKDACQGDSGGPIFVKCPNGADVLVGLVSWGYGCADPRYPGVYARMSAVSSFMEGIAQQLGQSTGNPPPLSDICGGPDFRIADPETLEVPELLVPENCLFGLLC